MCPEKPFFQCKIVSASHRRVHLLNTEVINLFVFFLSVNLGSKAIFMKKAVVGKTLIFRKIENREIV